MNLRTAVAAVAVLLPASALAYPLNPWGAAIPDKTVAINPFLYAYPGPGIEPILYAGVGIGGRFDVYAGAGYFADLSGSGGSGFDTVELFPRFFLSDSVALTPHFYWTPSADLLIPAPELHYAGSWDSGFAFTLNTGWKPDVVYGAAGRVDGGELFAYAAPEWYFNDQFSVFVELHEDFDLVNGDPYEQVDPGIWFALDKDQVNSFAIAAQLDLPAADPFANSFSMGVWYATTFGIGGGS